jgi:hypothetical protein
MLVQAQLLDSSAQDTEILIGAKFLTQIEGIEVKPNGRDVTYFHMLFDCHQVVEAEGLCQNRYLPDKRRSNRFHQRRGWKLRCCSRNCSSLISITVLNRHGP